MPGIVNCPNLVYKYELLAYEKMVDLKILSVGGMIVNRSSNVV